MTDNLRIWNALGKTDPNHTKGFSRAGGFKGTAIKPIWTEKRMTEQFGPCGLGWGMGEPRFEVVTAGDEVLVYCTVSLWYVEGDKQAQVYGVGGDKCVSKRKDGGAFTDDEAFKKAFTDAIGNAMKHIGVAADIHMGLFDDSKYVAEMRKEFADDAQGGNGAKQTARTDDDWRAWQQDAFREIDKKTSVQGVNEWLVDNKATLEEFERAAPAMFAMVKDRAMKKRATLTQAPGKAA